MKRVLFAVLLCASHPALADRWVTAELPAATAVSSMQEQAFKPGAMPALGAYVTFGHLAVGARVRAGVLRDGASPGGSLMDPGVGGLATAGIAGRVMFGGGWLELVAGGGITGGDKVPAFEAGAGWTFDVGAIDVGPSARYVRVVASARDAFGDADLVLVGVDVVFGRKREHVVSHVAVAPPPPPPPAPEPKVERDGDTIAEVQTASCADLLEFLSDDSGCGPGSAIEVSNDRIILDDKVLFDTDHAHVHSAGRDMLKAIAKAADMHPEWITITVEGHADLRGDDAYNQALSERRAQAARDLLVKYGVAEARIKVVGFGRMHPRDPGTTPEAHRRNRRVEFAIDRTISTDTTKDVTP